MINSNTSVIPALKTVTDYTLIYHTVIDHTVIDFISALVQVCIPVYLNEIIVVMTTSIITIVSYA